MRVEHILLSSDAGDESARVAPPGARVDHARLDQSSCLRRCEAHFALFDHFIAVETTGLGRKPLRYQVDLAFIDPVPKRARTISWTCLIGCVALGLLAVWLAAGHAVSAGSVAAAAGALLCAVAALYRSHDRLVFYSRHGRVPLLILFNRNPDAARLQRFRDTLIGLIEAAHADWPDHGSLLSAELREHRRLMEEDVLSAKRYAIVRQRILEQHQ